MSSGLFIVFEGGEGSGKSTQAELLHRRLLDARQQAALVREPGTTTLGLYLREYLKSKQPLSLESELLLFAAARAQLVSDQIRPALEKGIHVIADRFAGSTVAYQGYGRGIKLEVIDYLNDYVTGGLAPDVTFLLDANPGDALERVGSPQLQMALTPEDNAGVGRADVAGHRRFEDQSNPFHNRVRRGYLDLAKRAPGWVVLDASLTIEALAEHIWSAVGPLLPGAAPPGADTDPAPLLQSKE